MHVDFTCNCALFGHCKRCFVDLESHNCNTVSIEQALAWQRPLSIGSGMSRHMISRLSLSSVFSFRFASASLKGCKRSNLCFTGETETSRFKSPKSEKLSWDQLKS